VSRRPAPVRRRGPLDRRTVGWALALLLGSPWASSAPLELTDVRADPRYFVPAEGPTVLRFRLSAPAAVTARLYDGRDRLVRTLRPAAPLAPGDHALNWEGTDEVGRLLPPEEYRYTLVAEGADGQRVAHDLTDLSGGDDIRASDVTWDPEAGTIRYRLSQPARVNIRVGLRGGPLLGTILDWVARDVGAHQEPWDGFDTSRVLDLGRHPDLMVAVSAFALSANALVVGPPSDAPRTLTDLPWGDERRPARPATAKRMYAHAQQALTERGDFGIDLSVPADLPTTPDGTPIVSGEVALRLDVAPRDRERALARRFETVFYVDGLFAFENEGGFLPMTWRWNSQGANEGMHFLTANLRGYEGNFGVATVKVHVRPQADPEPKTP